MRVEQGNDDIQHYSSWREVPEHFASKTTLRSQGLAPGPLRATVYQRSSKSIIELYSIHEAVPRKAATEKQLAAIEKARAAQIANRTCASCNTVMRRKRDLSGGMCSYCHHELFLDNTKSRAIRKMSHWLQHKADYVVIDVETNQFDEGSEIIEIAVVDLDESILFESFVKPAEPVSPEAYNVHGISDELLKRSPKWPEVWSAAYRYLEGKTLLIYNESFDRNRIYVNCTRHGILMPPLRSDCVMETFARVMKNYSQYHKDFTWIALKDALDSYHVNNAGAHRAAADCINVVRLIQNVVMREDGHAEDKN